MIDMTTEETDGITEEIEGIEQTDCVRCEIYADEKLYMILEREQHVNE